MPYASGQMAVLFAVVCDSEGLYRDLGDHRAHQQIAACMDAMAKTIGARAGRVVKTSDAEMLAILPDADCAYQAASDIGNAEKSGALPVRIGFNVGPVIEVSGDVFGDTVNLAARVASLARAGEALMNDETFSRLSEAHRAATRLLDRETMVKGKSAPITVHLIAPPDQEMTIMAGFGGPAPRSEVRLGRRYRDSHLSIHGYGHKIAIGRVDGNDLVVADTAVSRLHATIEGIRGRFHIADISTNGTYLQAAGRSPLLLKREKLQLTGSGSLSLGRAPEANADHVIWFEHI